MKHSTHRILTTHVGSLPRPPDLLAMTVAKEKGAPFDAERYVSRVKSAVAEVGKKQAEAGIDDRLILVVERVGNGDAKFLVGAVEFVLVPAGELGRRYGRHEGFLAIDRSERRF